MNEQIIAGIDIGETKIAIALAAAAVNGEILFRERFPTRVERGAAAILTEIMNRIETAILKTNGVLTAIGIGCAGPLDLERGIVLSPPNLPDWNEFPIVELVTKRFGVPVILDNDANAAAIAEHQFGAGRGFRNLIYLTISTGIGGGIIIIDNKIVSILSDYLEFNL